MELPQHPCAMRGKECPSCPGCAGGTHSCTPAHKYGGHLDMYSIASSVALRECITMDRQRVFSPAEIKTGFVCRHGRYEAERQYKELNGTEAPKRAGGRPPKHAPPSGSEDEIVCKFCTCELLAASKGGARPGQEETDLKDAACELAGLPLGTRGCQKCRKAMDRRVKKHEALALAAQQRAHTPLSDLSNDADAPKEAWKALLADTAAVDRLNDAMEKDLVKYEVPALLQRNFEAYLQQLGCEDGKPPSDLQIRIAKVQLAQQGNHFYGKCIGRGKNPKDEQARVINGFQRGLAKIVMYSSDEVTLRALHLCGVAIAVRTANEMENKEAKLAEEYIRECIGAMACSGHAR